MKARRSESILGGLAGRLAATYAALGLVVTALSLLAGSLVQRQAETQRAEHAELVAEVQELYSLVASASEEGFSYALSSDRDEQARFDEKLKDARERCAALLDTPTLPSADRGLVSGMGSALERMRVAGRRMFVAHERDPAFDADSYQSYEAAIDGAWDSVAALDSVVQALNVESAAKTQRAQTWLTLGIGLAALAFAVALGKWLGRRIAAPLIALRDAAQAFGAGSHYVGIEAAPGDEVGDLALAFETMRGQVVRRARDLEASHSELARAHEALQSNQRALIAAEKMAAIGRLTAGFAHELNSPLTAIMVSAGDLKRLTLEYAESIGDPAVLPSDHRRRCAELSEDADIVEIAADRMAAFVRSLRAQTRQSDGNRREPFQVLAVLKDTVNLASFTARAGKCTVALKASLEDAEAFGNPSRLGQAVSNLLQNAIDATGDRGGGEIVVTLDGDGDWIRVRIADHGGGIPTDVLPRIFEPLYTTKPYGQGTGLGLAIVKEAVEQDLGGLVSVDTVSGTGSTFTLRLPRREGRADAA